MARSISDLEDEQQYPSTPGIKEAVAQLEEAVRDSASAGRLLVFQCGMRSTCQGLADQLSTQARAQRSVGVASNLVDAFLDLTGHPDRAACCIARGNVGYWNDLSAGLPAVLAGIKVLAINGCERMLDVMPVRLTRFIQWCAAHSILVVMLVEVEHQVLSLDLDGIPVFTDSIARAGEVDEAQVLALSKQAIESAMKR